MSAACRSLALPPLTHLPAPSRVRPSSRPASSLPSTSVGALRSLSCRRAPKKRRKIGRVSCFMHEDEEEPSSSERGFEVMEIKQGGEQGEIKLEECSKENNGWISQIRKVSDRIFVINGNSWTVPWTVETIVQVMLLWIASFWFVGSWIIPFLAHAAGFSKESLTHRGQALYSLLTDVAEGLAGIAILHRCLARFRPLPSGWFKFSLKGSWHMDVGLGCLLFPLVNFLSQINISMVPVLPAPPVGVSSVEQSILARDPVAMAIYVVVVSVCAPIWEEIVFRGFLLPSLTRYMPLWGSILVSAVAFALAHFNAQRLLPLVFLGVVMGVVFARSRNLLASMLLHSLWNGFVFLDLMK
ncbi:hypothetical protein Cni_G16645 [Canna indica]|uniref:CAAX prenyl protease 2/Lysostaphin resistance protein A-like domain-containing protein n=1 Tax=Canna indica TaxID=4628 RepID=A0AAQ3KI21_9LILI|nr:hypothetical protein Cni_G16645 [Canna indica]